VYSIGKRSEGVDYFALKAGLRAGGQSVRPSDELAIQGASSEY
jgi:hypothetical protein